MTKIPDKDPQHTFFTTKPTQYQSKCPKQKNPNTDSNQRSAVKGNTSPGWGNARIFECAWHLREHTALLTLTFSAQARK